MSIRAYIAGWVDPTSRELHAQAEQLLSSGWGLGALAEGYPPLTVMLAGASSNPLFYALISALAFGCLLQTVLWSMVRTEVAPALAVVLLAVWIGVPAIWYEASERFDTVASVALLALAIEGWRRFAFASHTDGGITAGCCLAVCVLLNPMAALFCTLMALSLLIVGWRARMPWRQTWSMVAVLVFPSLMVAVWWVALVWIVNGDVAEPFEHLSQGFTPFLDHGAIGALSLMGGSLLYTPLYAAVAWTMWRRTRRGFLVYVVPWLGMGLAAALDFPFVSLSMAYFLLCLVAIATIPTGLTRAEQAVVAAVALVQMWVMLAMPFDSGYYQDWLKQIGWYDLVLGGLGLR